MHCPLKATCQLLSLSQIDLTLTDGGQVDDVTVTQVQSPVLIGRSEDLNEVTRLGVSGEVRRVRVIRGHLQYTPNIYAK